MRRSIRDLVREDEAATEGCPHDSTLTRRFNGGRGAWTCDRCNDIVAYGNTDPRTEGGQDGR